MRFFTKSYIGDFPWLELSMKTAGHFCKEPIEWVIVVDSEEETHLLEIVLRANKSNKLNIQVRTTQDLWPESMDMGGYYRQQFVKMNAHRAMDGIFWAVDSDVIFQKPFSQSDFLSKSGRPILWFSQYNALMGGADDVAHRSRQDVIQRIFHIPEASFEWMRGLPIALNAGILKCGSERQEWRDSEIYLRQGHGGFSEFCVIGEFTHQFFPDAVEFRNAETSGPTFSGGYVQGGAGSGNLDGVSITSQFWSYGGLPPGLADWVNAL